MDICIIPILVGIAIAITIGVYLLVRLALDIITGKNILSGMADY